MAYFTKFPLTRYDISKTGERKLATDILRRVVMRQNIKDESSFFDEYVVPEGETPELTAYRVYGLSLIHISEPTRPY